MNSGFDESPVPRPGIEDLWNAGLCKGARYTVYDLPEIQATAKHLPVRLVSWPEARQIHRTSISAGDNNYRIEAFIHCYLNDPGFSGELLAIWDHPESFYKVASHFSGIVGIDFRIMASMPMPVRRYQLYRIRLMEHGAMRYGIPLIPNAHWSGLIDRSAFYGSLPIESPLALDTAGIDPAQPEQIRTFREGIEDLIRLKRPSALVIHGPSLGSVSDEMSPEGIEVLHFNSATGIRCDFEEAAHV